MARLEKQGRKYLGEGFNIEDYIRSINARSRNNNKNDSNNDSPTKRGITLADIPKVDASNRSIGTFIKSKDDED